MPALGLICLQLVLSAHLALERHAVSTAGELVEVGSDWSPSHAHDDRSLCDAGEQGNDWPDVRCEALLEGVTVSPPVDVALRARAAGSSAPRSRDVRRSRLAVWLYAPKASPPAI